MFTMIEQSKLVLYLGMAGIMPIADMLWLSSVL